MGCVRHADTGARSVPACRNTPNCGDVLSVSERARKRQHAGMEGSLASQDFQRMLLRFGAWMHGEQSGDTETALEQFCQANTGTTQPASHQARQGTGRRRCCATACLAHRLQKLRYSTEMFGSFVRHDNGTKDYVAALSELQDILGTLNDIAVAHRLLNELDSAARRDTIALIRGWMEHDYAERVAEFGKAWKRFVAQKGFWK